jgi:hypothetical protein
VVAVHLPWLWVLNRISPLEKVMAIKNTEEALRELLTAAEIIDTQAYPPEEDDVEYLGDVCRQVRDYLISSETFPWKEKPHGGS